MHLSSPLRFAFVVMGLLWWMISVSCRRVLIITTRDSDDSDHEVPHMPGHFGVSLSTQSPQLPTFGRGAGISYSCGLRGHG